MALEVGDLVLLEQPLDALGERIDHLGLALHHGGQVEFHLGLDAVFRKIMLRVLVFLGGFEQRLARDAARY
ncbi:MAG: hypothetical protein WDN72_11230 [Alphaproteobacteria bacterium]